MNKIPTQMLEFVEDSKNVHRNLKGKKIPFAIYRCGCGRLVEKNKLDVNRNKVRSCGKCTNHGMTGTRFYRIWKAMKNRALNPNYAEAQYYSGRGITICERWLHFESFKEDMYEDYLRFAETNGEKNTGIDRMNVNGNYELSNCRWATNLEQQNNKRSK